MSTFSKRLQQAMDTINIKPAELSTITGIAKSSISEYLSGTYEPKQKNIYRMASALKVQPSFLMGVDAYENTDKVAQSSNLSPKEERQIESDLEDMLHSMASAAYEGDNEFEDIEAFKATIKSAMLQAKRITKKKYTPKKYQKDL